jgi:hypothetical protein
MTFLWFFNLTQGTGYFLIANIIFAPHSVPKGKGNIFIRKNFKLNGTRIYSNIHSIHYFALAMCIKIYYILHEILVVYVYLVYSPT